MTLKVLSPCPYSYLPSGILIVEPHQGLLAARSMLLAAADHYVGVSHTYGSEAKRDEECEVTLAILSESLGYALLSETARIVRDNWPRARILIFGSSRAAIEDSLYDARIDHRVRPEDLLAALLILTEYPRRQKMTLNTSLEDGGIAQLLDRAVLKGLPESDHVKRLENHTELAYPRDLPGEEQHFIPAS